MKKVLFATTALIATASMAAAEVRISGYGRFGLDYNDSNDRAGRPLHSSSFPPRSLSWKKFCGEDTRWSICELPGFD